MTGKKVLFIRRKFLIEKDLQLSIILYMVGLFAISIAILYFALSETLSMMDSEALRIYPKQALIITQARDSHVLLLRRFFLFYAVVTIPLSMLGGLFLSHRIAGPVYRLRTILKQLLAGQKPFPLQLRKDDFMKDIILLLKEFVEKDVR